MTSCTITGGTTVIPAKIRFTFGADSAVGEQRFYLPTLFNGKYVDVTPTFDFTVYTDKGAPIEQITNWGLEVFSDATGFTDFTDIAGGTRVNKFRALITKTGNELTSSVASTWNTGGSAAIRAANTPRTLTANVNTTTSAQMGIIVLKLPNNY